MAAMRPDCRRAQDDDFTAIERMLELYQYELSDIWEQHLSAEGDYGYDLSPHRQAERFFAHGLWVDGHPAGFALVAPAVVTRREGCWMEQFFVLKRYRRQGFGAALAAHALAAHPGAWEIGQIPGNRAATAFWRRVIGGLTGGAYEEVEVTEGWWQGTVQVFDIQKAAS
jgi:predicted acetyltransferase